MLCEYKFLWSRASSFNFHKIHVYCNPSYVNFIHMLTSKTVIEKFDIITCIDIISMKKTCYWERDG